MTPQVSVLIPARDAAATLPACLASVRRQSEPRFECVVVDDGSADATRAVAERFAADDARFRIRVTPRRGLVPALLDGLAACRAPLVARLDADDLAHRRRLELQAAALAADPTLAGVGCHVRVFPRAGLRPGLRGYEAWLRGIRDARAVRAERFVECPLPHPTWMLRREALLVAPWRDAGWPEDYDLLLRWLEAGRRICVVPRRLVAWRDGPGRMWRTSPAYAPERFVACKAHFLARGPLRHSAEYVLWGHGATGRALRRALAAEGRHPAAIVEIHPRRIGRRIGGAPVVRPEAIPAVRRGLPLVASVSGAFARSEIRAWCARLGLREDVDFWCAA
ncbi:MAG TPA: glycosyltransferase [Myxococcota bacterium]|nr:glycosyltransferase [Myxococcota bacterium]